MTPLDTTVFANHESRIMVQMFETQPTTSLPPKQMSKKAQRFTVEEKEHMQLLLALVVPDRVGALPIRLNSVDLNQLTEDAETAGVVSTLKANAEHVGLHRLVELLEHPWQRQCFQTRERLQVAHRATERLHEVVGGPPIALGSLASTMTLYDMPDMRLSGTIHFLVPKGYARAANAALSDLNDVKAVDCFVQNTPHREHHDRIWLRAAPPGISGWRLPALEDLLLMSVQTATQHEGLERLSALVDLTVMANDYLVTWDVVAERARAVGLGARLWHACIAARCVTGALIDSQTIQSLKPGRWQRLIDRLVRIR